MSASILSVWLLHRTDATNCQAGKSSAQSCRKVIGSVIARQLNCLLCLQPTVSSVSSSTTHTRLFSSTLFVSTLFWGPPGQTALWSVRIYIYMLYNSHLTSIYIYIYTFCIYIYIYIYIENLNPQLPDEESPARREQQQRPRHQ